MQKKITFYLDFDGTVVEHAYPAIGTLNPGSIDVIRKLQQAGHQLILNTYRADLKDGTLEAALSYLHLTKHDLLPISDHTSAKIHPPDWNWNAFMKEGTVFLDDVCSGTPMRRNIALEYGFMVDWIVLNDWFESQGVYQPHSPILQT
jgi:hypothetical protein